MKNLMMVCATMLIVAGSACASITVYTDRPTWEGVVVSFSEESFDDATLNLGVSVVSDNGYVDLVAQNWYDIVNPAAPAETTMWSFATPILAFGGDWNLNVPGGPGTGIQLYLDGTQVGQEIPNNTEDTFWGVVSTSLFNQVLVTAGTNTYGFQESYTLDNMVYSPIPAPGAVLLGGIGVSIVGWMRRRRML